MSSEIDPDNVEADLIDADYEPAATAIEEDKRGLRKPGWVALGVTGLLAAFLGGAGGALIGAGGAKTGDEAAQIAAESAEKWTRIDAELASVLGALKSSEARLTKQIEIAAEESDTAQSDETLAEIRSVLEEVSGELSRLDADLENLDTRLREKSEGEGADYDRLLARIEALEEIGDDDEASPRETNIALQSIERRLDELDSAAERRRQSTQSLFEKVAETNLALDAFKSDIAERVEADAGSDTELFAEELEAVSKKVSDLEDGLESGLAELQGELEKLGETDKYDDALEDLRRQTGRLQTQMEANEATDSDAERAALLAMIHIEGAARSGQSFKSAHEQLSKAVPGNRAVQKLRAFASKATPTMEDLHAGFSELREEALQAGEAEGNKSGDEETGGGALGWIQGVLGDAVVVRRTGDKSVATEGLRLKLDAAEAAIADGNLTRAVGAVQAFDPSVRSVYIDWIETARDRQDLDEALEEVRTALADKER